MNSFGITPVDPRSAGAGLSLGADEEEEEDFIHSVGSLLKDVGCAGWGGAAGGDAWCGGTRIG